MYLQQKITSPLPKDKSLLTDQQKQTQMMTTLMPVIFTFIFYKFPSGLNLYWLSSTLLGIAQQWMMKKEQDSTKLWKAIEPCIENASMSLDVMRREEGENLNKDLTARVEYIESKIKFVEKEADKIPMIYQQKLMEKISNLTNEVEGLDTVRIAQEAAIISDKSDVSEEIVRIYSHIKLFRDCLDSEIPQGRKLNFLIQEFNREFNTIGSKAGSAQLSHIVVDLKSELEKIREQVQNIE